MSKEKIVYIPDSKTFLHLYSFYKEQRTSIPMIVFNTSYPRKHNFEVNL